MTNQVYEYAAQATRSGHGLEFQKILQQLIAECPGFSTDGFGLSEASLSGKSSQEVKELVAISQAELFKPDSQEAFWRSVAFLRKCMPRKSINRSICSYTWKHHVERFVDGEWYVPTGILIAAAEYLGFRRSKRAVQPCYNLDLPREMKLQAMQSQPEKMTLLNFV